MKFVHTVEGEVLRDYNHQNMIAKVVAHRSDASWGNISTFMDDAMNGSFVDKGNLIEGCECDECEKIRAVLDGGVVKRQMTITIEIMDLEETGTEEKTDG